MPGAWNPEWVELAKSMGPPPSLPEEMNDAKKQAVNTVLLAVARLLPPPPDDVEATDFVVPDGPKIRAYKPTSHQSQSLPVILFAHGGGWYAGNLDTEDRTCRMICSSVPAWVVSVDYRCHFDVPLEHEVDDCLSAFEWAQEHASSHGADPRKIAVWGGSAGGQLATATVYRLVQQGRGDQVAGLVSMNGLACHPDATPEKYKHLNTSYKDNAGPLPFVSGDDTLQLYKERDLEPQKTPIGLFPAAGGPDAVRGFPPTYVITSDNDAVRDDGTVLAAILKDAEVPVKHDNIMGFAHYFWSFPLANANVDFWWRLTDGIRWTLKKDQSAHENGTM